MKIDVDPLSKMDVDTITSINLYLMILIFNIHFNISCFLYYKVTF
jgi:hypothetical protein